MRSKFVSVRVNHTEKFNTAYPTLSGDQQVPNTIMCFSSDPTFHPALLKKITTTYSQLQNTTTDPITLHTIATSLWQSFLTMLSHKPISLQRTITKLLFAIPYTSPISSPPPVPPPVKRTTTTCQPLPRHIILLMMLVLLLRE